MNNISYEMTEEIAYRLGKFDFLSFYQLVRWKINKEPFPLLKFFHWGLPCGIPISSTTSDPLWDNFTLEGSLKLDMIKTIPQKLAYIRGRLESYSVTITETTIGVCYANSHNFRDFFAQCLQDVIYDRYLLNKTHNSRSIPKFEISKRETVGTCPATPSVFLNADKEIIEYITGKQKI